MTVYCHRCGGTGTITLAGHAYGCDGSCRNCPEPYPEPCPDCEMDRIIGYEDLPYPIVTRCTYCENEDPESSTFEDRDDEEDTP